MEEKMMNLTENTIQYINTYFKDNNNTLCETDPELLERLLNFAFDEVVNEGEMDDKTRFMAILSTLLGAESLDLYREMVPGALNAGVTPVEVKEIVYQACAYLGIARVYPFLAVTNTIFTAKGIALPLEGQAGTTMETRMQEGENVQCAIFGEHMHGFAKSGPSESMHINKWLVDNCFGDYYTRSGLDKRQREMITFCFLSAQGGCEPQLTSHAKANMNVGNDKTFLIAVISQCLPYIGYPRSLNALRCVNEAAK